MSGYPTTRELRRAAGRNRIQIGGVDVTNLRDAATPFPRFTTTEPFAYGSTSIQFPQVHAGLEADAFGTGDLAWVREGARVVISRTFDHIEGGGPEKIDYVGRVISVEAQGRILNLDIGGEFAGPASLLQHQTQMFRYTGDVGRWAARGASTSNLRFTPQGGPVTGIQLTHVGGQSHLSWMSYVCTMSQDDQGLQRTFMPTVWGGNTWEFRQKDYTTVHGTVFNDDKALVLQVVRDASEAPNVIYGTGITPDGERITNAKFPGVFAGPAPDYPMAGDAPFGIGTTDADTVNGDGITVLEAKLADMGYERFNTGDSSTYDTAIAAAVKKLQAEAGLSKTGIMTVEAWNALFDNDVTGYSINGAYIAPLAEDPRVRKYNRTSNGSIAGLNPLYDPNVLRVEQTIDFGEGITKAAMIAYAEGIINKSTTMKNWAGTLRLEGPSVFSGSHADDTGLTADDILSYRDLRPGMNLRFPYFDGDTVFHVSGVDFDDTGATLTVDTQARDLVEVREILARNAESRRDPRREWMAQNQTKKPSSAMIACDENFGWIDRKIPLKGGQWNRFPVIGGQQGQVNRVDVRLADDVEFSMVVLSKMKSERWMHSKVPNPLSGGPDDNEGPWETADIQDLLDDKTILYASGEGADPCGYGSKHKYGRAGTRTSAPLIGRHLDDAPWPYIAAAHTAVIEWVMIYVPSDTAVKKGRIVYPQLNDTAA